MKTWEKEIIQVKKILIMGASIAEKWHRIHDILTISLKMTCKALYNEYKTFKKMNKSYQHVVT